MIQQAVISIKVVHVLFEVLVVVAPLVSVRRGSSKGPVCLDLSQQKRKRSWEIRCWGTLDLLQVKPLMPNYFLFHFLNLMVEHTHTHTGNILIFFLNICQTRQSFRLIPHKFSPTPVTIPFISFRSQGRGGNVSTGPLSWIKGETS